MAYTKQIVNYINTKLTLNAFTGKLDDAKLYGIAMMAPRNVAEGKTEFLPIVFDDHFDNGTYVEIDDVRTLTLYHKNNGMQSATIATGVGDGNKTQKQITSMSMIVFAKRTHAGMTPEELFDLINSYFPERIDSTTKNELTGLDSVDMKVNSANFNMVQILQSEFKLERMRIAPSDILIQVNYTIECTCKKDCIITCCQ